MCRTDTDNNNFIVTYPFYVLNYVLYVQSDLFGQIYLTYDDVLNFDQVSKTSYIYITTSLLLSSNFLVANEVNLNLVGKSNSGRLDR